jgi:type II secretory pathway component PulC
MQRHIHYIIWGVQGLGVLLTGLFLAMGVNAMVSSAIAGQSLPQVTEPKDAAAAKDAGAPTEEGALESRRNIFNHALYLPEAPDDGSNIEDPDATTDKPDETPPEDATDAAPDAPLTGPQPTDLPLTLIGTQVASDPRWSIAIIKANDDGEKTFYARVGQTLLDDAAIVQIVRDRVYFRRVSKEAQVEYVSIDADPAEALARAARAATKQQEPKNPDPSSADASSDTPKPLISPSPTPPSKPSGDALDPSRIKVVDGNVVVPRDMADAIRNNQNLLKDPRFGPPPQLSPYYRNKRVEGFKIMGMQQGSLFNTIGLQNSDIIMNVNGELVDKPQKAMAIFDSLRPGEDVKVKVNRKGQIKTLTFKLD